MFLKLFIQKTMLKKSKLTFCGFAKSSFVQIETMHFLFRCAMMLNSRSCFKCLFR